MSWLTDVAIVDLLSRENRPVSIVDDRLTTERDFLLPTVESRREDIVLDPNKFLEMLSRLMADGRRRYEWVGVPGKEAFDVRNRYKPNTLTGARFDQSAYMRIKPIFLTCFDDLVVDISCPYDIGLHCTFITVRGSNRHPSRKTIN